MNNHMAISMRGKTNFSDVAQRDFMAYFGKR